MKEPHERIRRVPLKDLKFDQRNPNRGTERGSQLLNQSLTDFGIGRPVLVDRNLELIAGNKTVETAISKGFEEAIVVPVNGKQLVVAQRLDVDAQDKVGRGLAIADNQVALTNIDFDPAMLDEAKASGVVIEDWFSTSELDDMQVEELLAQGGDNETSAAVREDGTVNPIVGGEQHGGPKNLFVQHTPVLIPCPTCGRMMPRPVEAKVEA